MIIRNQIPVLEYDTSSKEIIAPDHGAESLRLPEKLIFAFLVRLLKDMLRNIMLLLLKSLKPLPKHSRFMLFLTMELNSRWQRLHLVVLPLHSFWIL